MCRALVFLLKSFYFVTFLWPSLLLSFLTTLMVFCCSVTWVFLAQINPQKYIHFHATQVAIYTFTHTRTLFTYVSTLSHPNKGFLIIPIYFKIALWNIYIHVAQSKSIYVCIHVQCMYIILEVFSRSYKGKFLSLFQNNILRRNDGWQAYHKLKFSSYFGW